MKKYLLISIGLFALVLLLASCEEPAPKVAYHSPADFLDDVYKPVTDCGFGSLVKPTNLTPGGEGVVTEASPMLSWDFSGCEVSSFTINLSDSPTFGLGNIVHDDVSEYARHLAFNYDYLENCTTYYWYVRAWGYTEYRSSIASFRTDFYGNCPAVSTCTGAPSIPIPLSPSDHNLSISNPQLWWVDSDPTCVASNYHYEVSHTPDFSEIVLEGDTTLHSFEPTTPYLDQDCTFYFWRVTAEANGYSRTSDVMQFGTQFTGMCGHQICQKDEINTMTKPTLISPADGSIVTDTTPQFLWDDNLDQCWLDHFIVLVNDPENFHNSLFYWGSGSSLSWTPDYEGLNNCTYYEWKVLAYPGPENNVLEESDTWSFTTDFGNTICGFSMIPIPVEMVQEFNIGCVSASQMWAIYKFKGPVFGEYEVRIGNRTWPCELMDGTNNQLMCYGPNASQQTELPVELFLRGDEEPALMMDGITPQCVGTVVCQPPAEGCSPKNIGDVAPVYVPTHWDPTQCACVP